MYNIESQLLEIRKNYNLVEFKQDNGYIFYGEMQLNHKSNEIPLRDKFYISMRVTYNYPNDLPIVQDIDKKIEAGFHKNEDDILCLACDTEIYIELKKRENVTISDFIELFLIPYFYSYTYYKKYGEVPFGQRGHGHKGILEFYRERLNISDKEIIFLLEYLGKGKYKGHHYCYCNSGKITRKCHIKEINFLLNDIGRNRIFNDFASIVVGMKVEYDAEVKTKQNNRFQQIKKKRQERKMNYYLNPLKDKFSPKFSVYPWKYYL